MQQLLPLFKPGVLPIYGAREFLTVYRPTEEIQNRLVAWLDDMQVTHGRVLTSVLVYEDARRPKVAEFLITTDEDSVFVYLEPNLPMWVASKIITGVLAAGRENGIRLIRTKILYSHSSQDMLYVSMGFKPTDMTEINRQLAEYCAEHNVPRISAASVQDIYAISAGLDSLPFWDWLSEKDTLGLTIEYHIM